MLRKIVERGCGSSSWIKFREKCLALPTEEVEVCIVEKDWKPFQKDWVEGGGCYKLELHYNRVGRFLLYFAISMVGNRFSLLLLEGSGLRGWQVLASKLRSLGALSNLYSNHISNEGKQRVSIREGHFLCRVGVQR